MQMTDVLISFASYGAGGVGNMTCLAKTSKLTFLLGENLPLRPFVQILVERI